MKKKQKDRTEEVQRLLSKKERKIILKKTDM